MVAKRVVHQHLGVVAECVSRRRFERLFGFGERIVISVHHNKLHAINAAQKRVQRIERNGCFDMIGAPVKLADDAQKVRIEHVRFGETRVEFNCTLKVLHCRIPINMI